MNATQSNQAAQLFIALVAIGILGLFAALSFFAFPAADDFAYFDQVNRLGFWTAQREWYTHWSGRFSATAIASLFALLPNIVSYYAIGPIITIGLTCGSFFILFAVLGKRYFRLRTIAVSSLVFSVIFISGLPNIAQSIYWVIGAATYQAGNIALVLLIAAGAQQELRTNKNPIHTAVLFVVAAALAFFAVGTNELTLITVMVVTVAMLSIALWFKRQSKYFWLAIFIVSIVAAILSISCPGNFIRERSLLNNGYIRPPMWAAAVMFVPWIMLRVINWGANPVIWVTVSILYFSTREQVRTILYRDGRLQKYWLWAPVVWVLLLVATNGLGFAINHYPLPDRAEAAVYLIFLLGFYPVSIILAHRFIPSSYSQPVFAASLAKALLVISIAGSPSVFEAVKDVYRGHRYSREMAQRFQAVEESVVVGKPDIVLPATTRLPRTISVTELSTDPREVANVLMAKYYGLNTIRLGDPAISVSSSVRESLANIKH